MAFTALLPFKDMSASNPDKNITIPKNNFGMNDELAKQRKDYTDLLLNIANLQKEAGTKINLGKTLAGSDGKMLNVEAPFSVLSPKLSELDRRIMTAMIKLNADEEYYMKMKLYMDTDDPFVIAHNIATKAMTRARDNEVLRDTYTIDSKGTNGVVQYTGMEPPAYATGENAPSRREQATSATFRALLA